MAAPATAVGATGADERRDVLAWLERRCANAAAIAENSPSGSDLAETANDRRRQLEVVIDELRGGLHAGAAQVAADIAARTVAAAEFIGTNWEK